MVGLGEMIKFERRESDNDYADVTSMAVPSSEAAVSVAGHAAILHRRRSGLINQVGTRAGEPDTRPSRCPSPCALKSRRQWRLSDYQF